MLIEMYMNRNEQAIKYTEIKYGKLCLKIANDILHNMEDAKECVNDAYMVMWESISNVKQDKFMPYLCGTVKNIAMKRQEYDSALKRSKDSLVTINEWTDLIPDYSSFYEIKYRDLCRCIYDFLESEKEDARNVFNRKYYFGDSIADIANRYSFSESKVKSILFHSRNRLRRHLENSDISI